MYKKILILICAFIFSGTCLSAEKAWYPKASDSCSSFVPWIKAHRPLDSAGQRELLWHDKALFKLRSDFYPAIGWNAPDTTNGVVLLIELEDYCSTHGTTHLGDISALDLINYFKEGAARSNDYRAAVDWYNATIGSCGSDSECVRIATSYRNHAESCYKGDQQACADEERDRKDWVSKGSSASTSTSIAPQDAMTQCLQDALRRAVEGCRQTDCPKENIAAMARVMQQAQCGYSAIETEKPILPAQPIYPTTSNCTSKPRPGGGFTTDCTQY